MSGTASRHGSAAAGAPAATLATPSRTDAAVSRGRLTRVGPDDPRLAEYVRLRDINLRKHLEAAEGLFIAEGAQVIRRAVTAGYPVRSFLLAERWLDSLGELVAQSGAPCYLLGADEIERVTGFHVHRGALASMQRLPLPTMDDVVAQARRVVVLEDVVDHTNVGAIFRSAAALGIEAVVLAPRCADPLYRRAVKVSMGAVFSVPYARMTRWSDGLERLRSHGFRLLALTPAPDAEPLEWHRGAADDRLALLLGTEGDGLSSHWQEAADVRVRIPMRPAVDSLNVGAAAAIACYVLAHPNGSTPC